MSKCTWCGRCCHYFKDGKLKKCRFALIMKDGKCICRMYYNRKRVGMIIDKDIKCMERKDSPFDYPYCTYNTGKPIHPGFKKGDKKDVKG